MSNFSSLYLALTVGRLYVSCPLPDPVSHPEEGVISRTVVAGAHLLCLNRSSHTASSKSQQNFNHIYKDALAQTKTHVHTKPHKC